MDLDEIIAEMRHKPDAQALLEWIVDYGDSCDDIHTAVHAYFEAMGED